MVEVGVITTLTPYLFSLPFPLIFPVFHHPLLILSLFPFPIQVHTLPVCSHVGRTACAQCPHSWRTLVPLGGFNTLCYLYVASSEWLPRQERHLRCNSGSPEA